jgi:hypothetical protein
LKLFVLLAKKIKYQISSTYIRGSGSNTRVYCKMTQSEDEKQIKNEVKNDLRLGNIAG